jgi:hypothetical protein
MTIAISGTTGITLDGQFNSASSMGFKNRIINGAMVIDQRNAGASVNAPTTTGYTLDRWYVNASQSSKLTIQQNAGSVTPPAGFTYYLGATSSSAYSITASDLFYVSQFIEGYNSADLAWGTASASSVTLSFRVYSSLTGTFGGALQNSANARSYPFTYSIPTANTWTTISVTVAGDTSGTWLTTNGIGIRVFLGLGVGSTYSGTAGAWAAGDFRSATGATSVVGTNGATFYITGVQLEKGSTATSFDYRPYGTELALCQRYYQKTFPLTTAPAQNAGVAGCFIIGCTGVSGYGVQLPWRFQVRMRATPSTITTYNPSATNANGRNLALSADRVGSMLPFGQNSMDGICYTLDSTGTSDQVGMAYAIHFSVDAEL